MIAEIKILLEVIEEMNSGVFDKTNHGECTQCGACCSNTLPLTKKEVAEIHKYVKANNVKQYKHLFPVANRVVDMTCPFMDDSKLKEKCRIYPVRPEICRQFSCCPGKRKQFERHGGQYEIINMRGEFFNENH